MALATRRARMTDEQREAVSVGSDLESLASQVYSRASRIEERLHSRLRGNDAGAALPSLKDARGMLEEALALVASAQALLNVDEEV